MCPILFPDHPFEQVMQDSFLLMLIFSLVLSLQGYYFGFYRPLTMAPWLAQSTFVSATFLLMPFLVFVLVAQSGAIERLENVGIRPHPGIEESVGIANGTGDNPTWVFAVQASSDEIHEFYGTADTTGEWSFQSLDGIYLRFRKDDRVLKIAFREGWSSNTLVYMTEDV